MLANNNNNNNNNQQYYHDQNQYHNQGYNQGNYANEYKTYDYVGGGNGYSDYSVEDSAPLQCYSCHFHIQYAHAQGMKGCDDPFDGAKIPEVTCDGPCGVRHLLTFVSFQGCSFNPNCEILFDMIYKSNINFKFSNP